MITLMSRTYEMKQHGLSVISGFIVLITIKRRFKIKKTKNDEKG